MEKVREITMQIENGHKGYSALWEKIKKISMEDIKEIYQRLNTTFDLYEGETDCYPYIPEVINTLKEKNLIYQTEIEYCGKKYNYVARLSKSLVYCPDQPFLNCFKTDQVTITPLVPKDGVPTHFQFYYDYHLVPI